jgi:hypothetical protein
MEDFGWLAQMVWWHRDWVKAPDRRLVIIMGQPMKPVLGWGKVHIYYLVALDRDLQTALMPNSSSTDKTRVG